MTEVEEYLSRFPSLKGDEYHCANCRRIEMCLALDFAQPKYHPDDALSTCSFFYQRSRKVNL